jgi:cell division protein FtsI/penicillin-binding protein 2
VLSRRLPPFILPVAIFLLLPLLHSATADLRLQHAVELAMQGHAGAAVVLEVTSGKILAARNLEIAAGDLVRPGSTLKPFVLMELLETGKLDARQRLLCKRPLRIGGVRMDCSHTTDVAELDADDAIAYSCNSYVAEVALRLDEGELLGAWRKAGLDSVTRLANSESAGRIDRPANQAQLQLMALGERGIEVTPLELLEAYRKLAAGKRAGTISASGAVFDGLEHAVAYGTAHAAFVDDMKVVGKTGTAAAANNPATHGLFVGYAPADRPEIAVVVYLKQGRGADAAMLARAVFLEYAQMTKKP